MLKCGRLASCKSLEFPETPKLPPLGRSQRLGGNSSDAVQTSLQTTEAQTTFLLSRAFEALYSAGKHFGAKQKRTPTAAGRGRQTPACSAAGAAARAPRWGSPGPPNLSQVFCSEAPPAQLIPFSGCRLGLQGRGFQGGDGSWCGRLANCCGRFMPLIGKLEMLAKSAAACIPAKSRGGGGGLAASARAAGAGPAPGKDARSQGRGPLRLQAGLGSAGAWPALPGVEMGSGSGPLGPAAGSASEHNGVAGLTICMEGEKRNFQ